MMVAGDKPYSVDDVNAYKIQKKNPISVQVLFRTFFGNLG